VVWPNNWVEDDLFIIGIFEAGVVYSGVGQDGLIICLVIEF
jgi:hypothetical protein